MEKIDRELLIKEISSRLPYGVKAQVLGWDEEKGEVEVPLRVYSINTDGYIYFESNDYDIDYVSVDNCLLYLRPMSSMTEEEIEDFSKPAVELELKSLESEANGPSVISLASSAYQIDWLNKHHFDFRNLIERGLAIDCTNLNIY